MAASKLKNTQYQNVVQVLDRLQGKSIPSYQGLNAFWRDPSVFLNASLYGNRLIADASDNSKTEGKPSCCGGASQLAKQSNEKSKASSCCSNKGILNVSSHETNFKIASQPFVAQADPDCWPSGGEGGGSISPQKKRSDASAIVIGLKGLPPFDGSVFPPLLWDSAFSPTSEDIAVVSNWIDAGCPLTKEEEEQNAVAIKSTALLSQLHSLSRGEMLHQKSIKPSSQESQKQNGMTVRKEISALTEEELTNYREALNCMFQYTDFLQDERSYDYWARIHTDSCQHGWEQFLPWHRLYLYFFEQFLQDYNPSISLPYWDWAAYADANQKSFNNTQYDLGVLPDAFGCYLNQAGVVALKASKSISGDMLFSASEIATFESMAKKGTVYNSGYRFLKAAGIKYELVNNNGAAAWSEKVKMIYATLKSINPLWYPTRWPGAMGPLSQYPTNADINLLLSLTSWNDFGGGPSYDHHYGALEKVHNGMHNFSGGTNQFFPYSGNTEWIKIYQNLGITVDPQNSQNPQYGWMTDNRVTAFDPLFWSHHTNVDRLWARWQEMHSAQPQEPDGVLAPWTMTVKDAMNVQQLGYTYMRDSVFFEVSDKVGLMNFKSVPSGVSQSTLDNHRKAEIKIHKIQRGNLQNVKIRVFVNAPDATLDTPLDGNDHFVEEVTTFHGSCYGGPGHCSLPIKKTRQFDQRMLHHHEPRNFKIDATQAVQKMLDKGEKDISIQLVVLGIDGKPVDNALYINGVSLNFFD